MIVAKRKLFDDLYAKASAHKKVLLLGCGTCVTVCMAGGEKEVDILDSQLKLAAKERGGDFEVTTHTIVRQCDDEFFNEETSRKIAAADAVISLACGVGIQFCSEKYPEKRVYAGVNTVFYGATVEQGLWEERCAGCGECIVDKFSGICPVARCSKSLMNGPCGGATNGKCEVSDEIDCAWALIIKRMKELGTLEELSEITPPRDWSTARDGGPRRVVHESLRLDEGAKKDS
jgi:ferredoxin